MDEQMLRNKLGEEKRKYEQSVKTVGLLEKELKQTKEILENTKAALKAELLSLGMDRDQWRSAAEEA